MAPHDWTEEDLRAYAAIGRAAPQCPICKEQLIARWPTRRFMENHRYVECFNGHLWELTEVKDERSSE